MAGAYTIARMPLIPGSAPNAKSGDSASGTTVSIASAYAVPTSPTLPAIRTPMSSTMRMITVNGSASPRK